MGRILLLLASAAVLALPAAAAARQQSQRPKPGFLVVQNAFTDGGVRGRPVATVAVKGFVIGHIKQEGAVEIFRFGPGAAAQVSGIDFSRQPVKYGPQQGTKFSGSDLRFRAVGGTWRVVVYGAGVSLYAGGVGRRVSVHGSVYNRRTDGRYSFDGEPFASMPTGVVTRNLGKK